MDVVIATDGRLIDIFAEGRDAGIRPAAVVPRDIVSVPLAKDVRFVVVATPEQFAARDVPPSPDDLLRHEWIRARTERGTLALGVLAFWGDGKIETIDIPGRLTLDEPNIMLEAWRSGFDLAYLPDKNCADDLKVGRLVQVLGDWMPPAYDFCLYYPGRRLVPAGLRALAEPMGQHRRRM